YQATTSVQVTMIECTGLSAMKEDRLHMVFPIPANRYIMVSGLKPGENVIFCDATGRFFSSQVIQSVNQDGEASLDMSKFPVGLYFLRIGEEQRFYRILKD